MSNIKAHFDHKIEQLAVAIDAVDWDNKETYCTWMNQQYYLVQNTTRYLSLAASLVPLGQSDEFRWWAHHLREELDHDKTLLKDMHALGWKELKPVSPEIRALIGSQYYDLQKNGPDALIGYALMLEGLSVLRCSVLANRVEKTHGKKSTYLLLHGVVDQQHYPEGIARVETLSPERQAIILQNLEMMSMLYLNFVTRLAANRAKGRTSNAA